MLEAMKKLFKNVACCLLWKIVVVFATILITNLALAQSKSDHEYSEFVYVNKSYSKDMIYSIDLYKSFEKFYSGTSDFVILVPERDLTIFFETFKELHHLKKIYRMPKFIAEELLFQDSDEFDYSTHPGHLQQQVAKLVFWRASSAIKNYITIDSDVIFIRQFKDSTFFENGVIKTAVMDGEESIYSKKIDDYFQEKNASLKTSKLYFVSQLALWNVSILKSLKIELLKLGIKSFVEMIKLAPVEGEWYGKYLYLYYPDQYFPLNSAIVPIVGYVDDKNPLNFKDEIGICNEYCALVKNVNTYGITLHFHTGKRSGKTMLHYMDKCKC
jgi:hypothetical protein